MEKTLATLMITLLVSVMGIPLAYLMGQRSAHQALAAQYEDRLDATLSGYREEIAALRSEMVENVREQARNEQATRAALESVGIEVAQPVAEAPAAPTAPDVLPISVETFDAAAFGTSYEDVVQQFGREGVATLTLEDGAGSVTMQYIWEWQDADGTTGRINLEFVDGLLNDKSYKE